jgi:hypothetical protein
MDRSKSIEMPFLREQNENFLRKNLVSQINALKQILENFISQYGK